MPSTNDHAYWEVLTIHLSGLMLHNQPYLMKTYGIAPVPVILGEPNCGKTTALMCAAHLSSNPARVYAANTTFAFLKQDKAGSSQWNAVDDNDKCTKEEVLAVSGFNALATGTKTDGSSLPISGTALTTNLTTKRSSKLETGRCVFIFKKYLGTASTGDMREQLNNLRIHNEALKSERQV